MPVHLLHWILWKYCACCVKQMLKCWKYTNLVKLWNILCRFCQTDEEMSFVICDVINESDNVYELQFWFWHAWLQPWMPENAWLLRLLSVLIIWVFFCFFLNNNKRDNQFGLFWMRKGCYVRDGTKLALVFNFFDMPQFTLSIHKNAVWN